MTDLVNDGILQRERSDDRGVITVKQFCFTIDDNIRFLKELTAQQPASLFDHPYPALLRRLHRRFGVKVQLNLFYRMDGFDLSQMTDRYRQEWAEASHWLRLSFHSELENPYPYQCSGYDEVYDHCRRVHREILRFAGPDSLARTTTVHCCRTTPEGVRALADLGMGGLLGLYGTPQEPKISYSRDEAVAARLRAGETVTEDGMAYAAIDMIVNLVKLEDVAPKLTALLERDSLHVMIHEQFFYADYRAYQPDFEGKLAAVFDWMLAHGYQSRFFEEMI